MSDFFQPDKLLNVQRKRGCFFNIFKNIHQQSKQGSVPADYVVAWKDTGSGAEHNVTVWRPVAPAGYQCLVFLASSGAKPETDTMRCVLSQFLAQAHPVKVWDDDGSGADQDAGFWRADALSAVTGVAVGAFRTTNSHSNSGRYTDYRVIRTDRVNRSQ